MRDGEHSIGSIVEVWHLLLAICLSIVAICGCKRCIRSCMRGDWNWRDICCLGAVGRNIFGEQPEFELGILVHQVLGMPMRMPLSVRIETLGDSKHTTISKTGKWNEELRLRVRQGARQITVVLLDDRKRVFGKSRLTFKDDLKHLWDEEGGGIIADKQIHITDKSSGSAKGVLVVSFSTHDFVDPHKEDLLEEKCGIDTENVSGHLGKLLADSQAAGRLEQAGELSDTERRKAKMMVLAGALKGPVIRIGNFGKRQDLYMKAIAGKAENDSVPKWHVGLWDSQKAADHEKPPQRVIAILRITAVFPEPAKPDHFVIRYATDEGDRKELMLKKVDRERDTWVEAFKLFIEELRKERQASHQRREERARERTERGSKAGPGSGEGNSGEESAPSSSASGTPRQPGAGGAKGSFRGGTSNSSGSGRDNSSHGRDHGHHSGFAREKFSTRDQSASEPEA